VIRCLPGDGVGCLRGVGILLYVVNIVFYRPPCVIQFFLESFRGSDGVFAGHLGRGAEVCDRVANVLEVKMFGSLAESVSVPKNATLTLRGSMNCPSALSVDFSAACGYLLNSAACSRK